MTTEPRRPAASATPTSVAVAKILAVGASAGSMLVLMAAMAAGQQEATPAPSLDPAPAVQPASNLTNRQESTPEPRRIGSSAPRTPQPVEVPRDPAPERVRSWVPKSVPRSVPAAPKATPKVTPARPAPAPTPRPVVRPAPPTRTPDATSRAS